MFRELSYQREMVGISTSRIAGDAIDQRTEKKILWTRRKVKTLQDMWRAQHNPHHSGKTKPRRLASP
jgi:hypothetical protein